MLIISSAALATQRQSSPIRPPSGVANDDGETLDSELARCPLQLAGSVQSAFSAFLAKIVAFQSMNVSLTVPSRSLIFLRAMHCDSLALA